ncbi:MAG: DUF1585 domain-containing protein, partial [Gammaproteobacteria bacterium]|nr:DUF1585 domain-containing protein [Gammaproteobacteria bacterium]
LAMRDHPKLSNCLVNRLYAYGTGGPVSLRRDRDTISWFENRFAANGYRLKPLLRELALGEAFSTVLSGEIQGNMGVADASESTYRFSGPRFGSPQQR